MSYSNCPCQHCGITGQGNVEYNADEKQWVFHCWLCSCETPIENKQIPPELQNQKYRYAEHVLKSAGSVAQSNFPRNINLGIKEN
jgi:hypothetical protein